MTMPFAGGIDANANATLIFSLVAAVIYASHWDMPPTLARSAAKTLAVAMLAVLAAMQGGPLLLVVALALSAVGDAFLSRDGDKAFLGGLASVSRRPHRLCHAVPAQRWRPRVAWRALARGDRAGHGGVRDRHAGSALAPRWSWPAYPDRRLCRRDPGDGQCRR